MMPRRGRGPPRYALFGGDTVRRRRAWLPIERSDRTRFTHSVAPRGRRPESAVADFIADLSTLVSYGCISIRPYVSCDAVAEVSISECD